MFIYLAMIDSDEEQSKFEQLYNTYRQTMFYTANNILKDTYLAEDAVHQAFLRIINHIDKIEEVKSGRTKSFVVIITENIAIDMYRKRKRENSISFYDMEEYLGEEAAATTEFSDGNPVAAAIAMLPFNYASVLTLKFSHGYSDVEIAAILSIKVDNVRQRIARAKAKLKKILEEGGIHFDEYY
ncbi:hypothetical protein acsn021_16120 [Anaerocolumna cellulosilytica]|uniref:Uncharacterized protein n=1 Tax=Anaerocolumna cellulosilytica TaxID=433286 RepID=A0A6S6QRR7_9FIRM|nr:RNA polymerase sigma factor [Anaerocolumna cellulosilytica]MBB5197236.1 RNA polymerase sigma-70 factor (ECF subfamily) [Anaerocolumna cellulosilytica]BCJ94043.1 hypothetical protein acsn021_16120 [Anaerocolumna cellulosilytica]